MRRTKVERVTILPSSARSSRKYDDPHWPRLTLAVPFRPGTALRIPIPPILYGSRYTRPAWLVRITVIVLVLFGGMYALLAIIRARNAATLVFAQPDLRRIWEWEVAAGHYPGNIPVPQLIGIADPLPNPARLKQRLYTDIIPRSRERLHLPTRPIPGSIADLETILRHCDYSDKQYVRDCLEVLRVGGGLDTLPNRPAEVVDAWKHVFLHEQAAATANTTLRVEVVAPVDAITSFRQKPGPIEQLTLPPSATKRSTEASPASIPGSCDPEYPRIFHMFWAGPFTDKPYMALLSYLYTQNLGLNVDQKNASTSTTGASDACRPRFWVWVNMNNNTTVTTNMTTVLADNPWSEPFLHPRFKDVIEFREWDTTQQLDSVPELRDHWRKYKDALLNSGGHIIKAAKTGKKDDGQGSVVLSDLARFVLCHRFGGIYLDADTIFLRDWEELWGWHGAFAYRWSWHLKYNTAVLRMHAGSALGTFLLRTALRNGLDFHPMTVSKYLADAQLDRLLFRCPDAMFDPGFLTAEHLQLDRPPFPEFQHFGHFFDTPNVTSAAPQVAGFDGFFRGAWSYHWHNFWQRSFDPSNNWPELGERFTEGEARQKRRLVAQLQAEEMTLKKASKYGAAPTAKPGLTEPGPHRDIAWSAVMKRTFESFLRGERPNMYGEWLVWPEPL